ncbi:MAG: hypothetical protein H7A05_05740 [Pseudomonadales bacterium]|nr:hypothetical protein [Pseudomonadales bacterium]MCP5330282.1 hypothetical protein [Pseudomonadales bacterium]MCP5344102.1 hypothetical protein [Pseudomonadales bacterium]
MCKGIELDENQKETLKDCIEESQQPGRSLWSRFRTGLTMVVIGMHSASNRIPSHYDPDNRLF